MADGIFNIAKGLGIAQHDRVNDNDPANAVLVGVVLKTTVADGTLEDFDTLAAILADGGVDEADFTNYARKILTDSDISASTIDDTNNRRYAVAPDQTFTAAGGTTDNSVVKFIWCYDSDSTGGTDANIVPISHHDWTGDTNGGDVTANFDDTNGYQRGS